MEMKRVVFEYLLFFLKKKGEDNYYKKCISYNQPIPLFMDDSYKRIYII